MPRLSGRSSRGFGASGSFPGGLGSAVAVLEYAAQERIVAQYLYEHAGVPTDGTNGTYAHVALPGALLIDTDAKTLYQNTGTQASPTWTERGAASGGGSGVQVTPLRTITSAELLALHTTGIAFDCPAGSLPIAATFVNHPGNTPYSSVGGNIYAQIGYPGGSRTNVLADVLALTAFLASAEGSRMIVPVGAALTDEPFIGATEVLTLSCPNADRHLADGNGTIGVQVAYLPSS